MSRADAIAVGYLIAAVLFIVGLKGLGRPSTARRGNLRGAAGMMVAVVVTLADQAIVSYWVLGAGLAVGTAVGVLLAVKVQMTAMPELVALFNGFGGAASALVATASFVEDIDHGGITDRTAVAATATVFIGALTFTGSVIAFLKLRESLAWSGFSGIGIFNAAIGLVGAFLAGIVIAEPSEDMWLRVLIAMGVLGALAGVGLVVRIGGADMPVVIALLNSLSGLAASAAGFVLDNTLLIVAGSLVGASGLILTQIMCVAMNRSAFDVVFSKPTTTATDSTQGSFYGGRVKSATPEDVGMLLETASRVVIVPGYGLAVAQAQHAVRQLTNALEALDIEVVFAIHPVAGRMPGQMNVLLAEAEIDYDKLIEMDAANSTFAQTDVAIVLGANDIVNPLARTDPDCPIAGMPILNVDEARTVVVIKRSLSPGFAGIENPLFAADNAVMLFGDGKQAVADITKALTDG